MMLQYWRLHKNAVLIASICTFIYSYLFYFLDRINFYELLIAYSLLFIGLFKLVQFEKWNFKFLLVIGILFRLIALFATPSLSQDFYRFIWDGSLFLEGISPYLATPNNILAGGAVLIPNQQLLYEKMGALSAGHYSNYPPLNQWVFAVSSYLGSGSIGGSLVVFKLILLAADIGILYIGKKLLEKLHISAYAIFWYFLNPLIIIEFAGNVHFEGLMLFFLLAGLYALSLGKWKWAAFSVGASISVKLLPLLLLPFFLPYLRWRKSIGFYSLVFLVNLVLFLPFYTTDFVSHYLATIGLWFTKFEFNASLYYVARWIGFQITGYNTIHIIGAFTPWITIALVLWFALRKRQLNLLKIMQGMLLFLSCYFFISTTVHPWYLSSLLLLSVFTGYRYVLIWTITVIWSYMAYSHPAFKEAHWALWVEYLPVYLFFIYEILIRTRSRIRLS